MVVTDILAAQLEQAAYDTDPSFGNAVSPGTPNTGPDTLHSAGLRKGSNFAAELSAAVEDYVAVWARQRKCQRRLCRKVNHHNRRSTIQKSRSMLRSEGSLALQDNKLLSYSFHFHIDVLTTHTQVLVCRSPERIGRLPLALRLSRCKRRPADSRSRLNAQVRSLRRRLQCNMAVGKIFEMKLLVRTDRRGVN